MGQKQRRYDFIVIGSILGLAVIFILGNRIFFQDNGQNYVEILVEGQVVETVGLNEDQSFSVEERPQITFEVKDEAIAFIRSDCPDKVCIHSGFQSHNGQSASCLPNQTTVIVRSSRQEADEPDLVTRREAWQAGFVAGAGRRIASCSSYDRLMHDAGGRP